MATSVLPTAILVPKVVALDIEKVHANRASTRSILYTGDYLDALMLESLCHLQLVATLSELTQSALIFHRQCPSAT